MGRRGRARGLTDRVVAGRHTEAADIARQVYRCARDLQDTGSSGPVPLDVMAALTFLGQRCGPSIAGRVGITDPKTADDIGAYLTSGFLSMVTSFNPEHFAQWREQADTIMDAARVGETLSEQHT